MVPRFVVVFHRDARDILLEQEYPLLSADITNDVYTFLLSDEVIPDVINKDYKYVVTNQVCL